jgi:hypothetical protein
MTEALHPGMSADQVAATRELQAAAGDGTPRGPDFETAPRIENEHSAPEADLTNAPPRARALDNETSNIDGPSLNARSPGDQKRLDMQARFRSHRETQAAEDLELAAEAEALRRQQYNPNIALDAADARPGGKYKLVVRGEELEVDHDQLIALAQKSAAGDSYFAESRRVLEDSKREAALLLENARRGANGHQPPPQIMQSPSSNPTDYQALYDELLYDDPDLGRQKLEEAVRAQAAAQMQADREKAEIERSKTVLAAFTRDHSALAADDAAMAVLQRNVFKQFAEDLARVGFDMSAIQNEQDLATIHMRARSMGADVRPLERVFERARTDFEAWRGGTPAARPRQSELSPEDVRPRRAEPRIEVNVDRSARRASIPTQPPRSSHPLRAPLPEVPTDISQIEKRSAAAQSMIESRRAARNGMRVNTMVRR